MKNIVNRPLFTASAAYVLLSCLAYGISLRLKVTLAVICALLAVISPLLKKRNKRLSQLVLLTSLSVALAASVSAIAFNVRLAEASKYDGQTVTASAVIEEAVYTGQFYNRYTAKLTPEGGQTFKVSLSLHGGGYSVGDVLQGEIALLALSADGSYNEFSTLLPDGVLLTGDGVSVTRVGNERIVNPKTLLGNIGKSLSQSLKNRSEDGAGLVRAVLLGDKSDLGDTVTRDFIRIGVSHTIAISGLHLSLVTALLEKLLKRSKLRKAHKTAVLCASIVAFMGITGFSSSVIRAGSMHLIRSLGILAGRRSDSFTCLGFAAALIVLLSPYSVLDAGFLLSAVSAYGCIIYGNIKKRKARLGGVCASSASLPMKALIHLSDTPAITLLVTVMTLPITLKYFGEISLLSPMANIIFIPLTTLLLYCGIALLLLCPFPSVAHALSIPIGFLEELTEGTAQRLSSLKDITVSIKYPGAVGLIAVLTVLLFLIPLIEGKAHKLIGFYAVLTVICLGITLGAGVARLSSSEELIYRHKGKNDTLLLRHGDKSVIVEATDGSGLHLRSIVENLKKTGCTEVESIVLTHVHKKHLSALLSINEYIMLREVLLPEPADKDEEFIAESIVSALQKLGVEVKLYPRSDGKSFSAGGIEFNTFDYTLLSRSTHPVVNIQFKLCGKSYVYAGGSANEGSAAARGACFNADTVIFGGHAPVYKSKEELAVGGDRVISPAAKWDGFAASPTGGTTLVLEENELFRDYLSE